MPRQLAENSNSEPNPGSGNLSAAAGNVVSNDSGQVTVDGSFNDMFDYASFMWDHELQSGNMEPTRWRDLGFTDMDVQLQRGEVSNRDLL